MFNPPPSIPTKQHGHWLLAVTCIAQSSLTKLRFYQMINKNEKLESVMPWTITRKDSI